MKLGTRYTMALTTWTLALTFTQVSPAADSDALTIYSTATPGAVPIEMYRPTPPSPYGVAFYAQPLPGYAIVKHERDVTFDSERSVMRFSDVAALLDPTTVSFASLSDPERTHVLEQSYEFDLVSSQKLMERFINREVTVEQVQGMSVEQYTGTLLSASDGLVLQTSDGRVQVIKTYANVLFPELPGGLITKPTLVWDVVTQRPGPQRVRVTYETKGITWWADYNVVFAEGDDANSGVLDIGAWVSILNRSGATYRDARLKLVAGDVHRAPKPSPQLAMNRRFGGAVAMAESRLGFQEKSFFEYHLYTLGRRTTIPDNSTKQIELFEVARGVPCEKVLVYYGQQRGFGRYYGSPMQDRNYGVQSNKKVDIYLKFKNAKNVGMGMPLPSGRIRVSKLDPADQTLEFIGEDTIDHTPKDEDVLIKLGSAFDVVGERKQTDYKIDTTRKWIDETIEIKLRNHKDERVKVIVKENLYRWSNWKITAQSHKFEKIDSRTIEFPIEIDPNGQVVIQYKVHYSW